MTTPIQFCAIIRQSFIGAEQVYTQGSCIMFHRILRAAYPEAVPYWNEATRHCISRIGRHYYDITGKVSGRGYSRAEGVHTSVSVAIALPLVRLGVHRLATPCSVVEM